MFNGHLLDLGGGGTPQEAVLDALTMFARALGAPVQATVIDRAAQEVTRLEVHPDGTSRTLAEDEPSGPDGSVGAAQSPPADRIERILRHAQRQELHSAFVLASALREHLTLEMGADHEFALEARAIEAYIAYLREDYRLSTVLALAVARIRCRTDLKAAADDVARATAAWHRLVDDNAVTARGRELLNMWDRLAEEGLLDPSHHAMAQTVRVRLDRIQAQEKDHRPGASTPPAEPLSPMPGVPDDRALRPARWGLRRFTRRSGEPGD